MDEQNKNIEIPFGTSMNPNDHHNCGDVTPAQDSMSKIACSLVNNISEVKQKVKDFFTNDGSIFGPDNGNGTHTVYVPISSGEMIPVNVSNDDMDKTINTGQSALDKYKCNNEETAGNEHIYIPEEKGEVYKDFDLEPSPIDDDISGIDEFIS